MVRKQVYLEADQEARLKALAAATGRTEAQVVRDALDGVAEGRPSTIRPDAAAWEEALSFIRARGRGRRQARRPPLDRDTLYLEMTARGRRAR